MMALLVDYHASYIPSAIADILVELTYVLTNNYSFKKQLNSNAQKYTSVTHMYYTSNHVSSSLECSVA